MLAFWLVRDAIVIALFSPCTAWLVSTLSVLMDSGEPVVATASVLSVDWVGAL